MSCPLLRKAAPPDAPAIAGLFRRTRLANLPYLPLLYTPEQDLAFFGQHVLVECEVWVAAAEAVLAFCAFRKGFVDHLYVAPENQGRGLGRLLLAEPMRAYDELDLRVFQRNTKAIGFYEACGFRKIATSNGQRNEEGEPDALYRWSRPRLSPGKKTVARPVRSHPRDTVDFAAEAVDEGRAHSSS